MKKALIIIDIQNIYFTEGRYKLNHPEETSYKALDIINYFRKNKLSVIFIKHLFNGTGYTESEDYLCDINKIVYPKESEIIINKTLPSSFLNTDLKETLDRLSVDSLVIAGMMSHMCVDTTVRAAQNYGYKVTVIDDACTTLNLRYKDEVIDADTVHKVFMASLNGSFAEVVSAEEFLENNI